MMMMKRRRKWLNEISNEQLKSFLIVLFLNAAFIASVVVPWCHGILTVACTISKI
jgi:hypothetical protein